MIALTNPQRGSWFMVSGLGLRPKQATWMRHAAAPLIIITIASSLGHAETIKLDASAAAARAVEASQVIGAARERGAAGSYAVTAADAARLPIVVASANAAYRSSVPEFVLPLSLPGQPQQVLFPDITMTYAAGVRVQQQIYTGGAVTASRNAARADARATEAQVTRTEADVKLAGQLAYWEAVRARAAVAASRAQIERAQCVLDDSKALFDAGMAVRADVLAGEERVATGNVAVINAVTAANNALAQLRSLLGIEPVDAIELSDTLTGGLPRSGGAPLPELLQTALERRPELIAAEARINASDARVSLAQAPARPALGAAAEWDYVRPNQRYFPQEDEWKPSWAVGLTASLQLFDGGKSRADADGARALERAARRDRNELARQIALEVETARNNLEAALSAVGAADSAWRAAQEREKASRDRYQAGLAAIIEVLDAEAQLANSEQQQIATRSTAWMAEAQLGRVVGQ